MQTATRQSVETINEVGTTIARIAEIASIIAAAVEQQDASTREISRNALRAAQGASRIVTNIAEANRGASETGSASAQVLESAQSLAGESTHLKIEVEHFLAMVRAA
jgi:methyl-accepting chemotaxis protein